MTDQQIDQTTVTTEPTMHTYKVGMGTNTRIVEAPSAAAAAMFYGISLVYTNNPFMAVVYEEDGQPWQGDAFWISLMADEAHAEMVFGRISPEEVTACRVAQAPPTLNDLVIELAQARTSLAGAKALRDDAYARWEAENAPLLTRMDDAKARVADAEQAVRSAGAVAFVDTGDKHPHPAVNIRMEKVITYDSVKAFEWAKASAPTLLKLDERAFDKVVRTGIVPSDVAQIEEIAKTTIATDLSAYVTGE